MTTSTLIDIRVLARANSGSDENCLARFHFAGARAQHGAGCDRNLALAPLEEAQYCEEWLVAGPVVHQNLGELHVSEGGGYALFSWSGALEGDIRCQARRAYERLLAAARDVGYTHYVRFWNHVPGITIGEADAERYRQFCMGRGEVLEPLTGDVVPPAGTAVGVASTAPLQVILLASKEASLSLENPRQLAAYRYPRRYGPKSPSFSRATMTSASQLFVSGTAAIVGHLSQHEGSLREQMRETLVNWQSLLEHAADKCAMDRTDIGKAASLRVYLKPGLSADTARSVLGETGVNLERTVILWADICRRELLFEMDGVVNYQ